MLNKQSMPIHKVKCSDYYKHFVSMVTQPPTALRKRKELYNVTLNWSNLFTIPLKCCEETKLQSFQYKILNRYFPCQYTLSIWFEDESPMCQHCYENEEDTIEHYFYQCTDVFMFWNSFSRWWKGIYGFTFILREQDVILGIENETNSSSINVLNFCILLGKSYIYKTKLNKGKVFLLEYIHVIKNKLDVMKVMYHTQDKVDHFEKHWLTLYRNI